MWNALAADFSGHDKFCLFSVFFLGQREKQSMKKQLNKHKLVMTEEFTSKDNSNNVSSSEIRAVSMV